MGRKLTMMSALVLTITFAVRSEAQSSSSARARPPQTVITHATWKPYLEAKFGISEQQFKEMGLGSLTEMQEVSLLTWANSREQEAKKSVQMPFFDCGRAGSTLEAKPEDYDKVRVYVRAAGDANEIISGVRERFRTMNGVDTVYSAKEADLTVDLVGVKTKTRGSGYETGTAFSVVVSTPCTYQFGTYTQNYDTVQNQFVQVGSDVPKLIDAIVSSIDTDDLENQRKSNAGMKKFLQGLKEGKKSETN
jgi:hypothetical protein